MLKIPALIDCHVHLREPGAEHKEDFSTGTAAALAGGVTTVLAMPNTTPPLTEPEAFSTALKLAEEKARCDYGIYLGASAENARTISPLAEKAAGLKLYLDATYGPLLLDDLGIWIEHFEHWPRGRVMAAHAEQKTLAAYLLLGELFQRPVHICHVSRKEEILLIRKAKQRGIQVTCEVAPQHLFLTAEDADQIGKGWSEVRPVLNSLEDQEALWDNLDVIDVIATDHAPHTPEEKSGENPPPGFPGLETMLPLLLTAVQQERLSLDELVEKTSTTPRKIFDIPKQKETWLEVDQEHKYLINSKDLFTKCGWTPFDGYPVQGYLRRVVLRGKTVYQDGEILAAPGTGKNIR